MYEIHWLWLRLKPGLWIRIRIRIGSGFNDFVDTNPDPHWESGSRKGKKNKKNKYGTFSVNIIYFYNGKV
jgi:hypothetical protein